MLTFLIPMILSNLDLVVERKLFLPLIILGITCFVTMFISATVLKPSNINDFRNRQDSEGRFSPFFFGNFYKMKPEEFHEYMDKSLMKSKQVKYHLAQDLYYVGKRLGYKMTWVRRAFNLFLIGLFLTISSSAIVLWLI